MNRAQFMEQLEKLLSDISEEERRKRWNITKAILTKPDRKRKLQ